MPVIKTWGSCFRSDSNSKRANRAGFWHSSGTARTGGFRIVSSDSQPEVDDRGCARWVDATDHATIRNQPEVDDRGCARWVDATDHATIRNEILAHPGRHRWRSLRPVRPGLSATSA